jgi:predicted RNase H-like nuclease
LKEESKKLQVAAGAVQQAQSELRKARDSAEEQLGESLGLGQAHKRLKAARQQLDTISAPILKELSGTSAWKTAKQQSLAAELEIEKLQADIEISESERAAKLKQQTAIMRRVDGLEKQAVIENADGKRASDNLKAAYAAVEKIRKSLSQEKIDADPQVKQAADNLDKLLRAKLSAEKQFNTERAEAIKQYQQTLQAAQALSKARAADAADSNKPKKKR